MKKNSGLTLIEVILSMAILGIIAITLFTVFSTSLRNIVIAGEKSKTAAIAEENLLANPEIVRTDTIIVELPSFDELKRIEVKGSYVKGKAYAAGGSDNVKVEIEAFVPGMLSIAAE